MEFSLYVKGIEIASGRSIVDDEKYDIQEIYELEKGCPVGTALLHRFGLKAEDVKDYINPMGNKIRILLSQEEAEKSGRLKDGFSVTLNISLDILKDFITVDVFDSQFGEPKEIKFVLKEKEFLAFWAKNNYSTLILSDADKEKLETRKAKREELAREKAEAEKAKEARETERREWILAHGSGYLKDCLELGVKAYREYVIERAALEFPGYAVDYGDDANWDEKFSPSPEALSELKKLRGQGADADIVWLTREPKSQNSEENDDDDLYNVFEPCEAIIIHNYLGKYNLVKEL